MLLDFQVFKVTDTYVEKVAIGLYRCSVPVTTGH